ncbi:MAG: hypothetical protein QM778_38065 [Myxococcales bacterium]
MSARGRRGFSLVVALSAVALWGCNGDSEDPMDGPETGDDAGTDSGQANACPTGGTGMLAINVAIEAGVLADVRLIDAKGAEVGDPITASTTLSVPTGLYGLDAYRVHRAGTLIGKAYQPSSSASDVVCVRADEAATLAVTYTLEPGSAHVWLTQSNGDGAQVLAFDESQAMAAGMQTPVVGLQTGLTTVGPLRIDGLGRLWVGSVHGGLVGFNTARLGTASTNPPDIVLDGDALCGPTIPCGAHAIAFDAKGAVWVALLDSIAKFEPASLNASGQPTASVRITSPSFETPNGLAFDAAGNLWVGESSGAIVRFNAARLSANIAEQAADIVIYAQQPGPVMIGLGSPEGLVFDKDGNLWVGYFTGNDLVRFTPADLTTSKPENMPFVPTTHIKVGVEALVTDLALDEAGNLWMPGGMNSLYRIAAADLTSATPALVALRSTQIGSAEKLTFDSVPGPLFITEPHLEVR